MNLRKEWFAYVAKVRRKHERKTKTPCTHRDAMKIAASTWPVEKVKLQNRAKREARRTAKLKTAETKPVDKPTAPVEGQ